MTADRTQAPRTAPGAIDRRELLLAAALELFDQVPFEDVTVDAVAERAGVARGLVAYYFGNKEGLYREVRELFLATLRDRLMDNPHRNPSRWLDADVQNFLHMMGEHPVAMRNTSNSPYSRRQDATLMRSFTVKRVLDVLSIDVEDPLLTAVVSGWGMHCVDLALRWLSEPLVARDDIAAVLASELRAALAVVSKAHPELKLKVRPFG